ncbi:hypothetical protein TGVAND_281040 [Toxoplasma gondii VAND]|uniref:Uncharacterized protein n=1 Tax=Toxoplasma gondii VAND TaxID=933077 RepID=A0A086PG16_TOXGO|nr:hypothetical protein TGVAND_281040 [Toxoplasma gondii VAND]
MLHYSPVFCGGTIQLVLRTVGLLSIKQGEYEEQSDCRDRRRGQIRRGVPKADPGKNPNVVADSIGIRGTSGRVAESGSTTAAMTDPKGGIGDNPAAADSGGEAILRQMRVAVEAEPRFCGWGCSALCNCVFR